MGFSAIAARLHLTQRSSNSSSTKAQQMRTSDPQQQRLAQLKHVRLLAPALYGQVWLCRDTSTSSHYHRHRRVAVKTVNLLAAYRQQTIRGGAYVREDVRNERRVHATLRKHVLAATEADSGRDNVLLVHEELEVQGVLYLVFDYCAGGDLLDVVRASPHQRLDERHARACVRDVARGLQFMHRAGFAHRDVSLENVLVTASGTCKLADFGLACAIATTRGRRSRERVGKQWYMAPEVYACDSRASDSDSDSERTSDPTGSDDDSDYDSDSDSYDPVRADMWSLGILFVILLTGAPLLSAAAPFVDRRFQRMLDSGPDALFASGMIDSDLVSSDARDLICCMLQVSPTKRITFDALLQHAFFQDSSQ